MQGEPTGFWGKLQQVDGVVHAWHPLVDHSVDVATVTEQLLRHTILGTRLATLAGFALGEQHIQRLAVIAALHDIGKFNHGFQAKSGLKTGVPTAGHVREVLALFRNETSASRRLEQALPLEDLDSWAINDAALRLLIAAIGHHGRPVAVDYSLFADARLWEPRYHVDPIAGISELVQRVKQWFPVAFDAGGEPFPDSAALQHAFSGLVMLADWLGSDTRAFPYSEPGEERITTARSHVASFLADMGMDPRPARQAFGPASPEFSRVWSFPPREIQRHVMDAPLPNTPSVAVLEAETGAGKTEAAIGYFLRMFHAGNVDGIYIALPTRTAATQLHGRVCDAMASAFPAPETRPPVVLAVPGYLTVDDRQGVRLPGFEVLWNDDARERFRFRGWAAETPKRYLAGAAAVGTIDQVLLSTLVVSHAPLRATALARHLLVVDEVHASDAYMLELLAAALRFHLDMGGHALLMSATLGASARTTLFEHISGNSNVLPLAVATELPYPAIEIQTRNQPPRILPAASAARPKEVIWSAAPQAEQPEAIAAEAIAAAEQSACVLIVRNTVKDCIATQQALETLSSGRQRLMFQCADVPAPHHSRYARPDRVVLDNAVELQFGKGRPLGGRILVATQTVQQSLDIDADLLITDLCPVDVLLQRIGRLHRHDRERPVGFDQPRCIVMVPETRDLGDRLTPSGEPRGSLGLGSVYSDLRIIEATWQLIESSGRINIPKENRKLVEAATHPQALEETIRGRGDNWTRHSQWVLGKDAAHRRIADNQLIDRSEPFGEYGFPDKDLQERISTRLGVSDRRAAFDLPIDSPFGQRVMELSIPEHLARGAGHNASPTEIVADNGILSFRFGQRRFVYDRLGLRPQEEERA